MWMSIFILVGGLGMGVCILAPPLTTIQVAAEPTDSVAASNNMTPTTKTTTSSEFLTPLIVWQIAAAGYACCGPFEPFRV